MYHYRNIALHHKLTHETSLICTPCYLRRYHLRFQNIACCFDIGCLWLNSPYWSMHKIRSILSQIGYNILILIYNFFVTYLFFIQFNDKLFFILLLHIKMALFDRPCYYYNATYTIILLTHASMECYSTCMHNLLMLLITIVSLN